MSDSSTPANSKVGTIGWIDLTVGDATNVRDFYRSVVGWRTSDVDLDGYQDYCFHPPSANDDDNAAPVAGVCHARGANANLPAQWIIYIIVADLDQSVAAVRAGGGEVLSEIRTHGNSRYCVIKDPAGAVCALYENNDG